MCSHLSYPIDGTRTEVRYMGLVCKRSAQTGWKWVEQKYWYESRPREPKAPVLKKARGPCAELYPKDDWINRAKTAEYVHEVLGQSAQDYLHPFAEQPLSSTTHEDQ